MDALIPEHLPAFLAELDTFIEQRLEPLQAEDDNNRFFDHRREYARTDWENHGLPTAEWEALLAQARGMAREAGFLGFALPGEYGGGDASNLEMAVVREHLAARGIGLHCDLQNEHSIVGNFPTTLAFRDFGSAEQRDAFIPGSINGSIGVAFGLTEPDHGSDATWLETTAVPSVRDGVSGWEINGSKMWTTGMHLATHVLVFARTEGEAGSARGITCFVVPNPSAGLVIEEWLWTFNMPTDHPRVSVNQVWVPDSAILGEHGLGLAVAQHFVHENRIRQAASSLGTARYCITESVAYALERHTFGKPLATNQAIQFRLAELHADYELVKALTFQVAAEMDQMSKREVALKLSDKVAICNYRANRLACEAADAAIQVHGAMGYSRYKQFEHHYRHHRRYRITEGSDEIQLRKIAGHLFGFIGRSG
ncbi:acyl-CoA dehydrogenase [Kineobactrum sediminis]|uniref:Acyl-CoA dehydrogenase n=1 Tax=Kineobactrum sediminis TaxID=1905677 RepID=A0A2N5Y2S8_9GAMM|nr:acyl-CoA dehydrogenase family protein [Kineobactrum sediminis]PLW82703.1 acyl-CoA dehydrogenase [Kineobactrum sediminis]